jgi:hypothetical protein
MTQKHTPEFWTHENVEYSEGYIFTVFDGNGKTVCYTTTEQQAAHIVKAVNMHHELVDALSKLVAHDSDKQLDVETMRNGLDEARLLLAKVQS